MKALLTDRERLTALERSNRRLKAGMLGIAVFTMTGCSSSDLYPSNRRTALSEHDYRMYGDIHTGEFLIDAKSGHVWQYKELQDKGTVFVRIPTVEMSDSSARVAVGSDPVTASKKITTAEELLKKYNFQDVGPFPKNPVSIPRTISLKEAMALPGNKGKSASEVKRDMERHDYIVVP